MQALVEQHGPTGIVALAMIFTGNFINHNGTLPPIQQMWCSNNSTTSYSNMPTGFEQTIIAFSAALPVLPLLFNTLTDENVVMLKAHVAGQSSSFGLSEIMRHYIVYPEPSFLKTCNTTSKECFEKSNRTRAVLLSPNVTDTFLCNRSFSPEAVRELFDSVHHVPSHTCALLGSSLYSFFSIIFYWQKLNNNQETLQTDSMLQVFLIAVQFVIIVTIALYMYYLYMAMDYIQTVGILFGAVLQAGITAIMFKST